jgi:TatD DNase family protein
MSLSHPGGWFDSHCHLDFLESDAAAAVEESRAAGVIGMITVGTDLTASQRCVEIASGLDGVWASVGVHPHDASGFDAGAAERLRTMAGHEKVVAIGETGLDYFRDLSPRADQMRAFRSQIEIAKELGLAVIVHMRDSHDDVFATLGEVGPPDRLVFHCFSGGPEEARLALDLGGFISFAGNVSYKSAGDLREAAAACPIERLLVETDTPFLAPLPHRGRPNRPALVPLVGAALAGAAGVSPDRLAEATSANARSVFGI